MQGGGSGTQHNDKDVDSSRGGPAEFTAGQGAGTGNGGPSTRTDVKAVPRELAERAKPADDGPDDPVAD
jgi:hypothetical protein